MEKSLYVYSGDRILGRVGTPSGLTSFSGIELFVGDIVQIWEGSKVGTKEEIWNPLRFFTAIVSTTFVTNYKNKKLSLSGEEDIFCMGLKGATINGHKWRVELVKSHKYVVEGENWGEWDFNYKYCEEADKLLGGAE